MIAYLVGAFLIGWGLWIFGDELLFPADTVREIEEANHGALYVFAPNMFCGVIIYWGVILILANYRHYGGGIWTFSGAILTGLAMILGTLTIDMLFNTPPPLMIFVICFVVIAFVFLLGCGGLFLGQKRHQRMRSADAEGF